MYQKGTASRKMRRCLFEMHGLSNWNSVYLSSFEKTPHKENAMPVTNKIIPVISTGNKLISDTVCQYLPNSVFHSVVFSIFMLAIKEVHSTINVPVSSNPVPAIIFFILRPPHLSICSLYPHDFHLSKSTAYSSGANRRSTLAAIDRSHGTRRSHASSIRRLTLIVSRISCLTDATTELL